MKALFKNAVIIVFGIFLLATKAFAAANTYDWVGTSSTSWTTATNWRLNGSTQTATGSYPGKTVATDIVNIGVNYTFSTSKEPLLNTAILNIASLTFGVNGGTDITLTVNTVTLTVTGGIVQNHGTGSNNSSTTYSTTLAGSGTVICNGNFQLGSNVAPTTKAVNTTQFNSQVNQFTIKGNIILYAVGNNSTTATNYPSFNLDDGQLTFNGQFMSTIVNGANKTADASAIGRFNAGTSTNGAILELTNNQIMSSSFSTDFYVDFYYSTPNNSTVIYDSPSGSQKIYTTADPSIGTNPQVYYDLTFAGASTKVVDGPDLTIGDDWSSGVGDVDLLTNNTVVTVGDDWTNSSNVTQGFGNISVTDDFINSGNLTLGTGSFTIGGNYTNSGTYTQSTGNTVFNGTSQVLTDSGFGTMFNNVIFNGNGGSTRAAKMNSGNFSISTIGTLTMANSTYLNANGHLTLNSDVNSSASVAAIPLGAGITGVVNVQRFIQGNNDITKRGFRAIASTVYTATVGGVNMFDLKYLLNSVIVTGLTGGGFNTSPLNNPSIYLFREDDKPPLANGIGFTTEYNWKGIAKINNTNAYDIGIQKRLTSTNLADTTTTIPVGNGVLFFFRGDKTHNVVNKTTAPFAAPEDVTTTQVGQLNTGTVNLKLWFANAANNLINKLSYTPAWVGYGTSSLTGGYTFVGNPYASTINWEKYNRNGTSSSIYGGGPSPATLLPSKIWMFNEASHQFEAYTQKTTITSAADTTTTVNPGTAQGSATNMIASGQGFFVKATTTGQSLSIRETAKTSTQPTASTLHNQMGVAKAFVLQPEPLFRLKLIKDTINTDEIVIRMNKQASTKFVENEDAEDMGGYGAFESLSAISSDSVALAIDYMPFPGKQAEVVPLLVDATASGPYKLANTQLDNLQPIYQIWLKDAFTHDSLLMKTGAVYSFTIDKNNPATFGTKRFTVVIGQDTSFAYQLLNFTATKVSSVTPQVQLAWTTKNEQNYTNFTVERSTDGGKTFAVIGGLPGSGAGSYSLTDKNAITGTNIYRLKQEDMNDSITYSKTVSIQFSGTGNTLASRLSIYPNPVTSIINVSVSDDAAAKPPYTIQITNTSGFVIRQVTSSQQKWETNVADLMPGTYIVKVHNSTDNTIIGDSKFVKL